MTTTVTLLLSIPAGSSRAHASELTLCPNSKPAIHAYFTGGTGKGIQKPLIRSLDNAKQSIWLQSYVFTNPAIAKALVSATKRGVEVIILADFTEATSDRSNQPRENRNRQWLKTLQAQGVRVQLVTPYHRMHNKVVLIDPQSSTCTLWTGSYNFTVSAERYNAENMLAIQGNTQLMQAYVDNWHRLLSQSEVYQFPE